MKESAQEYLKKYSKPKLEPWQIASAQSSLNQPIGEIPWSGTSCKAVFRQGNFGVDFSVENSVMKKCVLYDFKNSVELPIHKLLPEGARLIIRLHGYKLPYAGWTKGHANLEHNYAHIAMGDSLYYDNILTLLHEIGHLVRFSQLNMEEQEAIKIAIGKVKVDPHDQKAKATVLENERGAHAFVLWKLRPFLDKDNCTPLTKHNVIGTIYNGLKSYI